MKKILGFLLLVGFLALPLLTLDAAGIDQAGNVLNEAVGEKGIGFKVENAPEEALSKRVGTIINYILGVLGTVAVLYTIYGGVIWITAGGNDGKVTEAQSIIRNAVLGIVVIGLAYLIVTAAISVAAGLT
jgi:hypothetical protein